MLIKVDFLFCVITAFLSAVDIETKNIFVCENYQRLKYNFIPKMKYKLIIAFGPYDGDQRIEFETDRNGTIEWDFWLDFHQNKEIKAKLKTISSLEKVTILVENVHKAKRIISEFYNYADMKNEMSKNGGQLSPDIKINFNKIAIAKPDLPKKEQNAAKKETNEGSKKKFQMIEQLLPKIPVEYELEVNEYKDGQLVHQKTYPGQSVKKKKKFIDAFFNKNKKVTTGQFGNKISPENLKKIESEFHILCDQIANDLKQQSVASSFQINVIFNGQTQKAAASTSKAHTNNRPSAPSSLIKRANSFSVDQKQISAASSSRNKVICKKQIFFV